MRLDPQKLIDVLVENPIIAAVRDEKMLQRAILANPKVVFMLFGNIGDLQQQCRELRSAGKMVFLHVDLIDGLRPDNVGLRYIAEKMNPDGIITPKGACVRMAHEVGLYAIQRVFMLDSSALRSGVQNVQSCKPDLVEILPGVSPKALELSKRDMPVPIIAGGLIFEKEDVFSALNAGAIAVSSSHEAIWSMNG